MTLELSPAGLPRHLLALLAGLVVALFHQVLELLQHFILVFHLGLNLGLYVSVLLVHPAPLLLGRLLLGRKVTLKLGLQGLHAHLQLNLLVLCPLQLILQLLQLL